MAYCCITYASVSSRGATILNPEGVKDNSPRRKPWETGAICKAPEGRKNGQPARIGWASCDRIFRPYGACVFRPSTHGLRRGLLSFTPSGLKMAAGSRRN